MLIGRKFRQPQEQSRLSDLQIEELAADAEALLSNEMFVNALDAVYSRAFRTLVEAEVGSLTASAAHATIKGLEEIRGQLEQHINDHKMRQKFAKRDESNG